MSRIRNLQDIITINSVKDEGVDRVIDVIESEEEFALLDQQIIELDAIEIGFVDDYQNPVDVDFTW